MELVGRFKGIARDYDTRKLLVTFELEGEPSDSMDGLKEKLLRITAKIFRNKRSLDANSYYWQLLTKLAGAVGVSNAYAHNDMLRNYGQLEIVGGSLVFVQLEDTEDAARIADNSQTIHLMPTSEVVFGNDGVRYRTYNLLRGSSTYDTKEMSRLIDGLVYECKGQGIETLPPDELARMMEAYDKAHQR